MAHIAYPSTPNFQNFKADYVHALDRRPEDEDAESSDVFASRKRPPTRATFVGTVKLHGTNATIVFNDGDKHHPQIQSRSWILTDTKKDNCGTYALLSKAPLASLVDQILAIHGDTTFREVFIAGEVAGKGVQKGVAITALERFFAIFNIRIDGRWVDMRQYKTCGLPDHRIYNVAQYKTFEVDIDFRQPTAEVHERMNQYTTEVYDKCPFGATFVDGRGQPISGRGEGIVWTMVRSPYMDEDEDREFDDTFLYNFKTKGEQFSTTANAPKEPKVLNPVLADAVVQFVDYALAERRLEQGIEYLEGEQARDGKPIAPFNIKLTGSFMKWVTEDTIKEERNEMERLGVPEKDAKKEIGGRAKQWYSRKCNQIADAMTAG